MPDDRRGITGNLGVTFGSICARFRRLVGENAQNEEAGFLIHTGLQPGVNKIGKNPLTDCGS
jgi:hypothetical protein